MLGLPKERLDTPALIVDLDVMDRNIQRMTKVLRETGVSWRPHTKGIKVPFIAHQLIRAGAIGITCAKLGEAEVMAASGIQDILVANQIVGPVKIQRLMSLRRYCNVIVCVDSMQNAQELSAAAVQANVKLRILVEIDIGLNRSGIDPRHAAEFSRNVSALPGLRFSGLMGWEGHLARLPASPDKERAIQESVGLLVDAAQACRAAGLVVDIVSCGGTGTYQYTSKIKGVTEIEAGGGVFHDLTYAAWGVEHEFALTVLSTVISRSKPDRVVFDAGRKSLSVEVRKPAPKDHKIDGEPRLSAEHGDMTISPSNNSLGIGDVFELVPGYGDTTVCLHDNLVGVRDGKVVAIWPILARGKLS